MFTVSTKYSAPLAIAAAIALWATNADAKARFMGLAEAVKTANVVAVVHTDSVEAVEIQATSWTYRQQVSATPVELAKGGLTRQFALLAEKDFICASVTYAAPADYLVFLTEEAGHWVTVNHDMGALRIDDGRVVWPYDSKIDSLSVEEALAAIRAEAGRDAVKTLVELESPEAISQPSEAVPVSPVAPSQPVAKPPVQPVPTPERGPETDDAQLLQWQLPLAVAGGAAAVLLGFGIAFGRRKRS